MPAIAAPRRTSTESSRSGRAFVMGPLYRSRPPRRDWAIPFLVRLPKPGSYKGWLQFQRKGKVETVEVSVTAVNSAVAR
jgi:hypothetical protein